MENFNKNWLAILLIAVVFGILGFLLGRTTGHGGRADHRILKHHDGGDHEIVIEKNFGEGEETSIKVDVKIDTVMEDGKQVITKEVKKIK